MNATTINTYRNVGKFDAIVRVAVALALLGVVLSLDLGPVVSFALAVLSIPTMLFALTRWDPIYSLFGLSTGKDKLHA